VIRLTIDGEDEDAAAKTLGELVASGMGEAVD
jgi:phosphotransferase system HPr-like phosphotransfer protein